MSAPRFAGQTHGSRKLRFEPLEDRRLLSTSPWQNATLRLDVNNDGLAGPLDGLIVVNRLLEVGIVQLSDEGPTQPPLFYYDTSGDKLLSPSDLIQVFNRLNDPPDVQLTTLVPFTVDLTPQVIMTATSTAALEDGTQVKLDVDLDNDGNFLDPGETNYQIATLVGGRATFYLDPALPDEPTTYQVKLQIRVQDADGVEGTSDTEPLLVDTQTSTALEDYVQAADPSYQYSLHSSFVDPAGQYTVYFLDMKSQTWRTSADVDKTVWQHWVQVIVPAGAVPDTAFLLIDGGSTRATPPAPNAVLIAAALASHTVVIDLPTIPNEPLSFTGDNPPRTRSEDAIIAYSLDQFMDHVGEEGNQTWPVLVAMVKATVRAMDAVQDFIPNQIGTDIDHFVVSGYSKRGWTTWLTAAVDDRITAIIPGVFDNLNQGPQMVHHYGVYGFFAPAIQDYNAMNIFDRIVSDEGLLLSQIIDPYRYLNNGRFNVPKLMLNSTGDQFFVSDSAQFYINDIPGEENYLRYLPNTNHSLDLSVYSSSLSFYDAILNSRALPEYSWSVQPDGTIRVETPDSPTQVLLWQATNPNSRDFRKDFNPTVLWTSSSLGDAGGGVYFGNVDMPDEGATAYFVELTFPSALVGNPYVFTTEIRVKTQLPTFDWPFEFADDVFADNLTATPLATAVDDLNPAAVGLALLANSDAVSTETASAPAALPATAIASSASQQSAAHVLLEEPVVQLVEPARCAAHDAADEIFASAFDDLLA